MGQLGNQIFQVTAALKHRKRGEKYLGLGFAQFSEVFVKCDAARIYFMHRIDRRTTLRIYKTALLLSRLRIFGRIQFPENSREGQLVRIEGLFPVCVMSEGYPNREDFFEGPVANMLFAFSEPDTTPNQRVLMEHSAQTAPTCFVHVRRRDFLSWPSVESSAALPIDWFLSAMQRMEQVRGRCKFLVFSDDIDSLAELKTLGFDLELVEAGLKESFFRMLACDSGILSPSTFSWWVSWRGTQLGRGPYFAPQFWTNWRAGSWEEGGLRSGFLTYIPVE